MQGTLGKWVRNFKIIISTLLSKDGMLVELSDLTATAFPIAPDRSSDRIRNHDLDRKTVVIMDAVYGFGYVAEYLDTAKDGNSSVSGIRYWSNEVVTIRRGDGSKFRVMFRGYYHDDEEYSVLTNAEFRKRETAYIFDLVSTTSCQKTKTGDFPELSAEQLHTFIIAKSSGLSH